MSIENHHKYTDAESFLKQQYLDALKVINDLRKELEQERTAHEMTAKIANLYFQNLSDLRADYTELQERYENLDNLYWDLVSTDHC